MTMAYTARKRGSMMTRARAGRARMSMGDIWGDLSAIGNLASDPYSSEVVCHIQQLGQIKAGQVVQACPQTASGLPGGVGLDNVATALRFYVYAQQNTWVYPAAAVAILGVPFLLGYLLGE